MKLVIDHAQKTLQDKLGITKEAKTRIKNITRESLPDFDPGSVPDLGRVLEELSERLPDPNEYSYALFVFGITVGSTFSTTFIKPYL